VKRRPVFATAPSTGDMAKRRAQVVGHRVGKRFQFLVACLELRSPLLKLPVEPPDILLTLSALLHFDLKTVAGLTETVLYSASNSAECGYEGRPSHESQKVGQICSGYVEVVKRGSRKK